MSKSSSLRRIQAEIRELANDPSDQYHAAPLEQDMFEWHFTIRGASETDFSGGVYHGRILLPPEYPFKPPNILFLTPSGRFEINTKVCLSFSSFHPEMWQPAWGIRLILEALISFLQTPADGAIGALDWTKEERQKLAKESVKFRCAVCCAEGTACVDLLPVVEAKEGISGMKAKFHEEIEKLKILQLQNHAVDEDKYDTGHIVESKGVEVQNTPNDLPDESIETDEGGLCQSSKATRPNAISDEPTDIEIREESNNQAATSSHARQKESTHKTNFPAGAAATTTDTSTIPAAAQTDSEGAIDPPVEVANQTTLVSDQFLNGMIAALAVLVIVLLRQAYTLVDEMRNFEN